MVLKKVLFKENTMKKSVLAAIVLLASSHLFAANKLNCVVYKFNPNSLSKNSGDKTVTFRGSIESEQYLLIDENGATQIQPNFNSNETRYIFWINNSSDLVIIVDVKAEFSSMGKNNINVTNFQKGIALVCGL